MLARFTDHLDISDSFGCSYDELFRDGDLVETASISDDEFRGRAEQARTFVEETHDARITGKAIASIHRVALDAKPPP
jgi:hypothetical protein